MFGRRVRCQLYNRTTAGSLHGYDFMLNGRIMNDVGGRAPRLHQLVADAASAQRQSASRKQRGVVDEHEKDMSR
jgi:hypothetical protein